MSWEQDFLKKAAEEDKRTLRYDRFVSIVATLILVGTALAVALSLLP